MFLLVKNIPCKNSRKKCPILSYYKIYGTYYIRVSAVSTSIAISESILEVVSVQA